MRWTILLVASLCAAAPAAGQERRDTTRADSAVILSEIVVRAATPVATVGGASAVQASLDSLPLPPAPTLEQVFRALPMMHVRRNSRGEAEVSVRGSASRQVAVLVDGVPLTLAWDGRADVSVIPASAPQEIEFVRGLSSMLHGPNVLGGVVEMNVGQSLRQPAVPSVRLATEVDHVGGYRAGAAASLPFASENARWHVRAGGSRFDTPGQPLARGVTEPVPSDDLRLNTDATSVDGFASVRYFDLGGTWFSLSGAAFRAERGIAAELGVPDVDARLWRYPHISRTLVVASGGTGQHNTPLGRGDLEASLGVDVGRTEIETFTSRTYTEQSGFEDGESRTLTARLLGDHTLGRRADLRAAFTISDIRHDESLPSGDARYRQQLLSVGVETVWRAIERGETINWLRVSLGTARDVGRTPETGGREPLGTLTAWGARLGATMAVGSGATLVHGGISRRARFPSLRELYSGALDRFVSNPDLEPERLVAAELGVTTRPDARTELQAVAFHHRLNGAVVRTVLDDGRFFRVNRDRLVSSGIELLVSWMVGPVTVGGDLTAQHVELTDPRAAVTNEPENLPELFGSVRVGSVLPFGVRGGAELRYIGRQFCIAPGTGEDVELDADALVHADVSRSWSFGRTGWLGSLETRVSVDNVGDAAVFDQCGLPRPGRLVRFQVRVF